MKKNKGLGKLALGVGIGAALGILFAPKTGKETRKALKEKTIDLLDKVKEIDAADVKEKIENKVTDILDEIKDLDKEKALDIAKKKAKVLKKNAEDLAKYAKEKATPVVATAADGLRQKAIEITEKVLENLESSK